ncbi:MAG: hypothetical protein FWG89_07265 [Treponema sp.]|nr:hypothetical protein [Treponema sp.]
MKYNKKTCGAWLVRIITVCIIILLIPGCPAAWDEIDNADKPVLSTAADFNPVNTWPTPMLWSVYENHRHQEDYKDKDYDPPNWIREIEWRANIDWLEANMLRYGYNYVAIDGWGRGEYNQYGYRIKHDIEWNYTYKEWSHMLRQRGMKLGMYDNPLWLNGADPNAKVQGTDIYIRDITCPYPATWFRWVDVTKPGAEEFIKGNIRHWADMDVDYLKIDFMSWYESGEDKFLGTTGRRDRPREHYETAMRWIREEADKQGVFISLAMANLNNFAEIEAKYCHMIRISDDVWSESRTRTFIDGRSTERRDQFDNPLFPMLSNQYDGMLYYSALSGRGKVMLDGDYMWLNDTWWNNMPDERLRRATVNLHTVGGGAVSFTEQYNTTLQNNSTTSMLWAYQNPDLTGLARESFVGKPLSTIKYPNLEPRLRFVNGTGTTRNQTLWRAGPNGETRSAEYATDTNGNPLNWWGNSYLDKDGNFIHNDTDPPTDNRNNQYVLNTDYIVVDGEFQLPEVLRAPQLTVVEHENYSHTWWGETANGDYIIAFFHREGTGTRTRYINFLEDVGIVVNAENPLYARELWGLTTGAGTAGGTTAPARTASFSLTEDRFAIYLPSNGSTNVTDSRIYRLSRNPNP